MAPKSPSDAYLLGIEVTESQTFAVTSLDELRKQLCEMSFPSLNDRQPKPSLKIRFTRHRHVFVDLESRERSSSPVKVVDPCQNSTWTSRRTGKRGIRKFFNCNILGNPSQDTGTVLRENNSTDESDPKGCTRTVETHSAGSRSPGRREETSSTSETAPMTPPSEETQQRDDGAFSFSETRSNTIKTLFRRTFGVKKRSRKEDRRAEEENNLRNSKLKGLESTNEDSHLASSYDNDYHQGGSKRELKIESRSEQPISKRKRKKLEAQEERASEILGMMISIDPTSQLLDTSTYFQDPVGSKELKKHQKSIAKEVSLLGVYDCDDLASEDDSALMPMCVEDVKPPTTTSLLRRPASSGIPAGTRLEQLERLQSQSKRLEFLQKNLPGDHSIGEAEIVFDSIVACDDHDDDCAPGDDEYQPEDDDDGITGVVSPVVEHEIVFFPVSDQQSESEVSATSDRLQDCQSKYSDSSLPTEWFLPEPPQPLSYSCDHEELSTADHLSTDAPEYEWYLPEHQDVSKSRRIHSFEQLIVDQLATASFTTAVSTLQGDDCSSSSNCSADLVSIGSGPSEAVQSLLWSYC